MLVEARLNRVEMGRPGKDSKKTGVLGMVERDGDIMTHVIPDATIKTVIPLITENVEQGSTISTDEMRSYTKLRSYGYVHGSVAHSRKQWKNGIHHTNSIEGFWSMLKKGINSTHIHVSRKHLPKYLGEFEYRYNTRENPSQMFPELISSFPSKDDQ